MEMEPVYVITHLYESVAVIVRIKPPYLQFRYNKKEKFFENVSPMMQYALLDFEINSHDGKSYTLRSLKPGQNLTQRSEELAIKKALEFAKRNIDHDN